jgi:hypothetical protein
MFGRRSLSRFFSILGINRSVAKTRDARLKRLALFEALESRRIFATDMELFSFGLASGELRNTESSDAARIATARRVADFVEDRMGIDLATVAEATLTGKMVASDAGRSPVFTFEMDGMEWDIRDRRGSLEMVVNDHDLMQNADSPLDTNGNGSVDPLDVLGVINYINSKPTSIAPARVSSPMFEGFVDVNGDNVVSPMDVLMIINQLNSGSDEAKMPLIAEDDYFERNLPANATEFPVSEIDVLANDIGDGLKLVDVQFGNVGTVEIVEASDGSGKMVVRYTPGDQFRSVDGFLYTVEDASGNRVSAIVRVGYSLESTGDTSFKVNVSAEQAQGTVPGEAIGFQDADGNALISLEYVGDENGMVGVLVNFQPNAAPFGIAIAGTFASDATLENRFFPQLNGAAWIYGTLAEVNGILASLRFIPALGFSAPDGIHVSVHAFLYGALGVSTQSSSSGISVIVPKLAAAPITLPNFFVFNSPTEPVRLNVLDNDSSPSGSTLRLVGISQYPDVNELSVTTPFGTMIEIDPETNEIILTPSFGTYESFVYIVSDAVGRLSQGKVAVSLVPVPE